MEKILIIICVCLLIILLSLCFIWYNGVLEVIVDDVNGDTAKLEILEYDKIRKNKFMFIIIKRIKK